MSNEGVAQQHSADGTHHVFRAGSVLAAPTGAAVQLILRGRVCVERHHPALQEALVLLECGPGDVIAVAAEVTWPAQTVVRALTETETVELLTVPCRARSSRETADAGQPAGEAR